MIKSWVVFLNRPDNINELKTDEERERAANAHFALCFEKMELLMASGSLRFISKQESLGTACISGLEEEYSSFKKRIEEMGIGRVVPNVNYHCVS